MTQPLVSIIIPTYNRKVMVIRLIKSILASSYKHIEIVVIVDASTDGTSEAIKKEFPHRKEIQIFENKTNLYAAGSRNEGTKKSTGDYLFYIDDDNVVDKNTIVELVNVFESNPSIGELGLVNYSFTDKNKIYWLRTERDMMTSKTTQPKSLDDYKDKEIWDTADVPNAFMVRAKVLKKYNISFCQKLGIMYEESDLAYRIRNVGYSIKVVKNAKIYHDVEGASGEGKRKDYMQHFMNDIRRPYVFARNRILFHSIYSTRLELLSILCVWIWIFMAYYLYKILSYSGVGSYTLIQRLKLATSYIQGTLEGLLFVLRGETLSYS